MPRVLLVAEQLRGPVPGGIGTYVSGLASHLPDVTFWTSRRARPGAGRGADRLAGRPHVHSPLPSRALVWAWDRGWAPAPPGFDVVHAPSLAVPPRGRAPLAVTVHDLAWRHVPGTFPARGRRWHEAALKRALRRADAFVVPSRQTADDLVAAGAPARRVNVIEEGCDHLPPPDPVAAKEFRAAHGVEGEYLLTVSTLEPRKNLLRLVAAYEAARPRLPEPWPLLVVGPVGWGDALAPRPSVVLAGWTAGGVLSGLYADARLVATVPLFEGFGLPAVEAMAFGAPVVASPQPSSAGVAYEVDPTDVDAIADGLVRVATDDRLRDDLVAAGHDRAAGLTWATTAARHTELWESMGAGARR
jgi:glycosyltransferase involved in cell wall biosynthesis